MNCNEIKAALVEYLYAELTKEGRIMVETHLTLCGDCRAEFGRLQKAHALLNQLAKVPVSKTLTEKVLNRVRSGSTLRFWRRWTSGLAAAAALLLAVLLFLHVPPQVSAQNREPEVQKGGFTITVYNENLAMIKDSSTITNLKQGLNTVRFHGVTSGIKPDSVSFKSLTAPATTHVIEQNYEFDLVSASKVLQKYIDREIKVVNDDRAVYQGKLVSFDTRVVQQEFKYVELENGRIVQREESFASEGNITLASSVDGKLEIIPLKSVREIKLGPLPPNMVTRPTLVWELDVQEAGKHETEVGYLTEGMFWDADYVAVVSPDDTQIDFKGWVTLRNNSGASFPDASLKLIAGDVNIIKPPPIQSDRNLAQDAPEAGARKAEYEKKAGFVEKSFFEYHLYTLQGKTTLANNEVKQITLFPELKKVPVKKILLYNGSKFGKKVRNILEFENIKENNMGIPLPKGRIKVSKADTDGLLEHIGEDHIDHTPAGKKEFIRIFVGNAFDIVGEWKQTDTKRIDDRTYEYSYEIRLRNHTDKEVEVLVQEDHLEGSWEMVKKSHKYEKKDAHTIEFTVKVPAYRPSGAGRPEKGKEVVIRYTVRKSW